MIGNPNLSDKRRGLQSVLNGMKPERKKYVAIPHDYKAGDKVYILRKLSSKGHPTIRIEGVVKTPNPSRIWVEYRENGALCLNSYYADKLERRVE